MSNCIYVIDCPNTNWVKIGYGNLNRPGDSSYWTPFAYNANVKMWILTLDKETCFKMEQEIHEIAKKVFSQTGEGGIECYLCTSIDAFNIIDYHIRNGENNEFLQEYVETTVADIRKGKNIDDKTSDKTNINNMIVVSYEKIEGYLCRCEICNRELEKFVYECKIIYKNDDIYEDEGKHEKEYIIYAGSKCFKKLKNTIENNLKKTCNYFYNKYGLHDPVNSFIDHYLVDSRIKLLPKLVIDGDINIVDFSHKFIVSMTQRIACYHLFCVKGTFEDVLTSEDLKKYKLNEIRLSYVFYELERSDKYFKVSNFQLNGENEKFDIKFIHPHINTENIKLFFEGLRTKPIKYSKEKDFGTNKLDEEQQKCLNDINPFISGVPGSGKSLIIKYILSALSSNQKTFLLSPTYSSLSLITSHRFTNNNKEKLIKDNKNITAMVIAGYNEHVKLPYEQYDYLIIDEFYMFDICSMYKIMNFIHTTNIKHIKIFGDIYQLPSISFKNETSHILLALNYRSKHLETNYRAKNYKKEVDFLNKNKTDFIDLKNLATVFNTKQYNNDIIKERLFEGLKYDKVMFLAYKNETVKQVNQICYNTIKKEKCSQCKNDIKISTFTFCKECIEKFGWIVSGNVNFNKVDYVQDVEILQPNLGDNVEYSNKLFESEFGILKSVASKDNNDKFMFYNGQHIKKIGYNNNIFTIYPEEDKRLFYHKSLEHLKLSLNFASTVHKSQGMSIDLVTFIIDQNNLDSNLVFTALTRSTKPDKILILNKLDTDNISFNNIRYTNTSSLFGSEEDSKSGYNSLINKDSNFSIIYQIYNPKSDSKGYKGMKYIELYDKTEHDDIGWLNFMLNRGPDCHKNIFMLCKKYRESNIK